MTGGYDTASLVNDVWPGVDGYGKPDFWLRYFTPCYFTPINTSKTNANTECASIWDSNSSSPMLGPITTPTQSRLSGTASEGQADAKSFCSALYLVYMDVGPINLPDNVELYCWLDQEGGTAMSSAYWNAWAGYVDGYSWDDLYPLYACLYCSPGYGGANPCGMIDSSSDVYTPSAIWCAVPQECSNSLKDTPSWNAGKCSEPATELWQFCDGDGICNSSAVDQNLAASGFDYPDYCFWLDSKP
jgi:hypothetical protein